MVMVRNLVKVGNREVKKRYIGNKLIFEDLGDKTEILSGEEIYTDKADDSVVHVEIDGKSYQDGVPTPDYPIEIHSVNDFDVVSSVGKRNLIRNSDFKDGISNWWGDNGEVVNKDGYTYYEFTGNGTANVGGAGDNSKVLLEPNTEYIYSVDMWAEEEIRISRSTPLHYHIKSISTGKGASEGGVSLVSDSRVEANKWSRVILQFSTNSTTDGYLRPYIYAFPSGVLGRVKNFKLEKSSTITPYMPSLEDITEDSNHPLINKINLLLSEPLRSVGDVKDRLFRDTDGLWKIERNVGEVVLDGTETGYGDLGIYNGFQRIRFPNMPELKLRTTNVVSSHFPVGGGTPKENNIYVHDSTLGHMGVGVSHNIATNLYDFRQWLQNNNLNIYYELSNPQFEALDQELQDKLNNLRTFKDSNYVYTIINDKTDILPAHVAENLQPTLHATFKSKGWYDYYLKTLLK